MKKDAPNLIVFYSANCPQCAQMHDQWANLAKSSRDNNEPVNIAAINREANAEMMFRYHITKYPTIQLFQGGEPIEYHQSKDGHDLTE